ncbi:MAG: hypothetical protein ACXVCP_04225 [Bdellovibrio sp.]
MRKATAVFCLLLVGSTAFSKPVDQQCLRDLLINSHTMTESARKFMETFSSQEDNEEDFLKWDNFGTLLRATEYAISRVNNGRTLSREQIAIANKASTPPNNNDFQREEIEVLLRTIFKSAKGLTLNKTEKDVLREACGNAFDFNSFIESATIANAVRNNR